MIYRNDTRSFLYDLTAVKFDLTIWQELLINFLLADNDLWKRFIDVNTSLYEHYILSTFLYDL